MLGMPARVDLCGRDHVLPLDAQNNPQTLCMEVVEFSTVILFSPVISLYSTRHHLWLREHQLSHGN